MNTQWNHVSVIAGFVPEPSKDSRLSISYCNECLVISHYVDNFNVKNQCKKKINALWRGYYLFPYSFPLFKETLCLLTYYSSSAVLLFQILAKLWNRRMNPESISSKKCESIQRRHSLLRPPFAFWHFSKSLEHVLQYLTAITIFLCVPSGTRIQAGHGQCRKHIFHFFL